MKGASEPVNKINGDNIQAYTGNIEMDNGKRLNGVLSARKRVHYTQNPTLLNKFDVCST